MIHVQVVVNCLPWWTVSLGALLAAAALKLRFRGISLDAVHVSVTLPTCVIDSVLWRAVTPVLVPLSSDLWFVVATYLSSRLLFFSLFSPESGYPLTFLSAICFHHFAYVGCSIHRSHGSFMCKHF